MFRRPEGSLIGPANVPSTTKASGIWGLAEQAAAISGGSWLGVTPTIVQYLILSGGGGGGGYWGGGGGAGGVLIGITPISSGTSYTITVGGGGSPGAGSPTGTNGSNSVFSEITTVGGGGGGSRQGGENFVATGSNRDGLSGGSGGGACSKSNLGGKGIYSGSTYISATRQGYDGGSGQSDNATYDYAGGGGGAGAAGGVLSSGSGIPNPIPGSTVGQNVTGTYYIGGGGGAGGTSTSAGGTGGGGAGATGVGLGAGTTNTGGGGGGGTYASSTTGGAGGSGVVIITYPSSKGDLVNIGAGLVYTKTTFNANTIYTFTSGTGTITWG